MSIKINNTGIRIRPSAIDTFYQCSYQWAKVFLEGQTSIPNARAAIGTSIHRAAEVMWKEAQKTKVKEPNLSMMMDASVQELQSINKDTPLVFDDGENMNTATAEAISGAKTFVDDIVPFTPIPDGIEEQFSVTISDHPIVAEVGGTLDYRHDKTIADLKTSKRKPSPANYTTQQSTYKYLAEANGKPVESNLIQGVVLKKQPEGHILPMKTNVEQAKAQVNTMLDTLELATNTSVPLELLFRGNPKYYLCSNKYCALYSTCPFVKGNIEPAKPKL